MSMQNNVVAPQETILEGVFNAGPSGVTARDLANQLRINGWKGTRTTHVNKVLYKATNQVSGPDTNNRWVSLKLEKTSIHFLEQMASQGVLELQWSNVQRTDLGDGDRYSFNVQGVVKQSPGREDVIVNAHTPRPRRDPHEAKVCAAHSLLSVIAKNPRVEKKTRVTFEAAYRAALYRGRPCRLGEEWPVGEEIYQEFKGAVRPTEQWKYDAFEKSFDDHAVKALTAFLNSAVLYNETVVSQASITFGVNDGTRVVHGIWQHKKDPDPSEQLKLIKTILQNKVASRIKDLVQPARSRNILQQFFSVEVILVGCDPPPPDQIVYVVDVRLSFDQVVPIATSYRGCYWMRDSKPQIVRVPDDQLKELGIEPPPLPSPSSSPDDDSKSAPSPMQFTATPLPQPPSNTL